MLKRLTQFMLVAVLGVLLSVAFVPVASAEPVGFACEPPGTVCPEPPRGTVPGPDITLASPSTVELPATIVLSSPYPDVKAGGGYCFRVGTSENCYPYLVGRSGPDANGRYLSEWMLPMAPTGAIELAASSSSFNSGFSSGALIKFTVTGNRFDYTDFRSCTRADVEVFHPQEWWNHHPDYITPSQIIVDYYAQVNTSLTYQLQQKVMTKTHHWRWVAVKRYHKAWEFPIAHSELSEGYGPYERRETKQNVPAELLYPTKRPAPKYRVVYFVKKGKKLLKRGVVSSKQCQKINDPPYYIP